MPEEEGHTSNSAEPVEKKLCRNCEAELVGDFCHLCGQHVPRSERLNTREVLRDFFGRILNLESSFLRTLVGLTLRPGTVCSEYVEGNCSGLSMHSSLYRQRSHTVTIEGYCRQTGQVTQG